MHSDQDLPHSEISLHHQLLLDVCCPLAAHPSPLPDIFHSIPGSSPASDLRVQCCSIYGPSSPSSTLCIYQLQRPSLSPPSEAFAPFVGSMSHLTLQVFLWCWKVTCRPLLTLPRALLKCTLQDGSRKLLPCGLSPLAAPQLSHIH